VKGTIRLKVQDQQVQIPICRLGNQASLEAVLSNAEARKLLLASSDLTRVKVIRHDLKNGERHEWILDCGSLEGGNSTPSMPLSYQWNVIGNNFDGNNSPPPNTLWLRDGDTIEVPEKP
jgi:hypothetical protein